MKIKNKLIALLTILLVSCQYSPAYANIADNSTIYLGEQMKELSICKDIAGFAYVSMQAHQNGVSEEDQLALAPAPTTQEEAMLKALLDGIVHDANIFPIYDDMSDKVEVSERFSKVIYNICKGDK